MATNKRKAQLTSEMDSSGARKGFEEIKKDARDMAKAVGDAGKQAGQGLTQMGEGGEQAAQKLDGATKGIIGSIERATAAMQAGERGSAKYYEALAAQRGIDPSAIKSYIEQLKAAEAAQQAATGSLGKMGVSAAQTQAALRNVPAQFTDIVVSLQAGQAPLTVLLQQGGQLKDMFGGTGEAARALGGYVAGLINPYTLLAAAVGTVAFGYFSGRQESAEFSKTLVLTGNAAGTTAGQLMTMAAGVSAISGATQGRAAEVLNQIAASGAVGAGNMQRFTLAALEFERAGGAAAEETAKQFADLAKAPLQALVKLNEGQNFLTESTYKQVKSLEEQGRSTEAARVAQETYAAVVEDRTPQLVKNLGYVERAWLGIKTAAGGAVDVVKGVGRQEDVFQQLEGKQATLAERMRNSKQTYGDANADPAVAALQKEIALLSRRAVLLSDAAASEAQRAEAVKAGIDFDKEREKYLSKQVQMQQEITRAENLGVAAGRDRKQIEEQIAAIRAKYADKPAARSSGANREIEEEKRLILELAGLTRTFTGDWEKLNKQYKDGKLSLDQLTEAQGALLSKQPAVRDEARAQAVALRDAAKAQEEVAKAQAKYTAELERGGDQVAERVQKMREEEEALAKAATLQISLAQAIELVAVSRLQEQQAAMLGAGNQAGVDAIQREIDKRRELVGLIGSKEARDAAKKALTETERETERMARSIEQSLTDSLMRGFESGKGFAETLKGSVEAMFKTLVLRPTIEAASKQLSGGQGGSIAAWLPYIDAVSSASAGKWGQAAGTAFGAYVGGPLGAVIGKTLGSVADKVFSGGAGTPHMGAMYLSNGASGYVPAAGVVGDMAWGDSVYKNRSSQVEDYLKGVTTGSAAALNSISKNFGGLGGFQVGGYFAADNRDASQGNIKILQGGADVATVSARYAANGETGLKEYTAQLSAEVRKAIVGIGLPEWAMGMLNKLGDAPALDQLASTVDQINATQSALAGLDTAFRPLGGLFTRIADLSGDSTLKLASFAGGLEGLDSLTRSYYDSFYTEAEKTAATTQRLTDSMATLGLTLPSTREGFKALVDAATTPAKLATEEGMKTAAELLKLGPAFASITPEVKALGDASGTTAKQLAEAAERAIEAGKRALAGLADDRGSLEAQLLRAQGDEAGAVARELQITLARLTEGLNATDAAAATAAQAYNDTLRAQIDAAEKARDVAAERFDIEGQILQLQGDTAALRQRELDALDPSNREMQRRYYLLLDEKEAAAKAAQAKQEADAAIARAAEEAAAKVRALADVMSGLGNNRFDLENQLLTLQGNDAEVLRRTRERDLAELTKGLSAEDAVKVTAAYDYNLALRRSIEETRAATEAANAIAAAQASAAQAQQQAAEQIRSAWQSVTDTIYDEVARIKGLIVGSSVGNSLANAQTQFTLTAAQAGAGDQEAARLLPGFSQTLLTLAEAQSTSLIELQRIRAQTMATLAGIGGSLAGQFGLSIPRLAVGTNYVPADMLAVLHKGEEVRPAPWNPAAAGLSAGAGGAGVTAELLAELRALRREVAALKAATQATADATEQTRYTLAMVTRGGQAMQTQTAD